MRHLCCHDYCICGMYSPHGLTPQAIKEGKQATVKEWLQKEETKVNEFRGGSASHSHFSIAGGTALHWAAYYGQLEIAQLLIDSGAGMEYGSVVCPKYEEPPPLYTYTDGKMYDQL